MKKVIAYIIRFLVGDKKTASLCSLVGYTNDVRLFSRYKVVIIPSDFFKEGVYGTEVSIPYLPLQELAGVPLLFGKPELEWVDETLVVHADIIASAFFLLTRYEEIRYREKRDQHGRFPGKDSLPYRAGFLDRPVVDEYGVLLRGWLKQTGVQVPESQPQIKKVWLTHDVDAPFFCRSFRHVIRETIKGQGLKSAMAFYRRPLTDDPYYTFPWLAEQDVALREKIGKERCASILFFKSGKNRSKQDRPYCNLQTMEMQELIALCKTEKIVVGLHSSYEAGKNPKSIESERDTVERAAKQKVKYNRHHYLSLREPEDMEWLEKAGITDDFSLGYADVSGFRLGTSRPVRWINPITRRLSPLVLHPLTVMDVTLSEEKYMHMDYESALTYCRKLIQQVAQMNGELVLLWHNDTVSELGKTPWLRSLYVQLLEDLKTE